MVFRKIKIILDMIKFEHTIFALPFAIMSAFIASDGFPALGKIGWILLAMVGARSCAMAFNRLADADLDEVNPRTAARAIPAGRITKRAVWVFTVVSAALFSIRCVQTQSARICAFTSRTRSDRGVFLLKTVDFSLSFLARTINLHRPDWHMDCHQR